MTNLTGTARTPTVVVGRPDRPRPAAARGRLLRWALGRLLLGVVTLLGVAVVIFIAVDLLPGDVAQLILGSQATPDQVAALSSQLGLDDPMIVRLLRWLGGVAVGDFGESYLTGDSVWAWIAPRLANTLILMALAGIVCIPASFALGIWAARHPRGPIDGAFHASTMVLASLPQFVVGILLVMLFSTSMLRVLPATASVTQGTSPLQQPLSLVLPVLTLAASVVPYLSNLVRAAMLDALGSDYVVMARLKGLPPRLVLWRHALRNAMVPAIQGAALSMAFMLGGLVVIESLFNYPGLGSALVQSIGERDVPILQAIVMIIAAGFVVFNLIADVLTVAVTPTLRTR
ncbi:MAG: ABC transporter permease [Microbacterium sp.]|uniref:ABC transporter permease n=1 Tax=Microbacterium sp. TaxID=51671 RepID=UPI0039E309A2